MQSLISIVVCKILQDFMICLKFVYLYCFLRYIYLQEWVEMEVPYSTASHICMFCKLYG